MWLDERTRREIQQARRYAVVIRLKSDPRSDRVAALEARVGDLLAGDPSLGHVDGTGTDGEVWELFLDGADPDALWSAVQPLVEVIEPTAGSEVRLRRSRDVEIRSLA